MTPSTFVLHDSRSRVGAAALFWALGGGYTSNLDKAERFSIEAAQSQHASRETDIPLPLAYVTARRERMVDFQYLPRDAVVATLNAFTESAQFYAVARRRWDGNALYFVAADGQETPDVDQGKQLTKAEAAEVLSRGQYDLYPAELIEQLAYWRVREKRINRKRALADTGIVLNRVRQDTAPRYRCGACGKFCSNAQYFAGRCVCGWQL